MGRRLHGRAFESDSFPAHLAELFDTVRPVVTYIPYRGHEARHEPRGAPCDGASSSMIAELAIAERVRSLVNHPVFQGSDEVLRGVLDEVERKVREREIGEEFHAWLRDMILDSPHFREV